MTFTLPPLPAKHQYLVNWIRDHPNTPIEELLQPFNKYERVVRKLFAQEPSHPALKDNCIDIVPLYDSNGSSDVRIQARDIPSESPETREKYILPLQDRRPNGSSAVVPTLDEFKKNFTIFSEGSLSDMDWSNVVVAGSAVVTSLLPVPEIYRGSKRALRQFYHDQFAPASDVDLFLYGLTEEQAIEKIKTIEDKIKNAILYETTTVRTKNTITIVSQYPTRHVQIVLRIYKSIAEILTGFDVDCSCAAFDGKQVYVSPRALASYITQINRVDLSRRSPSYENRLSKYSHRGFEIFWPELDRSRVDPTIFERSFSGTVGLARLLVLEKLPKSSDREAYLDQRRLERGRPARPQRYVRQLRGNIKNDWEDETPEWVDGEEVSDYHTVTIPYGPRFHAKKIEKLLYTKDLLLNAEWNKPKDRDVHLHRHPAFFGNVEDVIHDCCGYCPVPVTSEEKEVAEKESKIYISGDVSFVKDDPGRQEIGSFNPITETDWTEMAYVGNTERLCHAIVDHDVDGVKEWLSQEIADPNNRDYTGRTPLHLACSVSTPEIVQCLVDHGARLTARLADGCTALHLAAARGSVELVRILLTKSAENEAEQDKNAEIRRGKAAEEYKCSGDVEDDSTKEHRTSTTTESFVLVQKESNDVKEVENLPDDADDNPDIYDINVLSWDSKTSPLHLAILNGHVDVVEELVGSFGADVLLPIKLFHSYNDSPRAAILNLALTLNLPLEKAKAMTEKLLQLGATPTQADLDHNTPLHYIAATPYRDLVDIMFEQSKPAAQKALNHIATNGSSWHPEMHSVLNVAIESRDSATVMKVLEYGAEPSIDFENLMKSARAAGVASNSCESNRKTFLHKFIQPVILTVDKEMPQVTLALLDRGVDPNTMAPEGYQVRDEQYWQGRKVGKTLLDCVRNKLLQLRKYNPEKPHPPTLRPLESDEHYINGLEEDSYKMWTTRKRVDDERKKQSEEKRRHEKAVSDATKDREGIEQKMASIKLLIEEFEKVEAHLMSKEAKTFSELFPDFESPRRNSHYSKKQTKLEPFKVTYNFKLPELTPAQSEGYLKLFEAAWSDDLDTIKALTLGTWGEGTVQRPLQIAVSDSNYLTPFSIAVLRGHLKTAKAILEIAQAQYKVDEDEGTQRRRRYEMDISDSGEDSDSDDGIRVYSEIVDDKFTIDDIGALASQVESTVSPLQMLTDRYPVTMFMDSIETLWDYEQRSYTSPRFSVDSLFEYAVCTDNVQTLVFLLEMGEELSARNPKSKTPIYRVHSSVTYHAIQKGHLQCLQELISRTGADLPLDALIQNSGVQVNEKPKYYQGLSIRGKKREDWVTAALGRDTPNPVMKSPPLLISAFRGNLSSTEWFLGTAPERHYLNFTQTYKNDKQLQLLARSRDGIERSIIKWLGTRSHLVLHCAILSKPTAESQRLVQYLITRVPEQLETKSAGGYTPLALAFSLHRVSFAKLLIDAGANQTTRDNKGNNLIHLMLCSISGNVLQTPDNVTKLLDLLDSRLVHSMFTERSSDGPGSLTPLARWMHHINARSSCTRGGYRPALKTEEQAEIVRRLLDFAQPTDQRHLAMLDGTGNTPVHNAVRAQMPNVFEMMIDRRPDLLHRENATGTTPLELAVNTWVEETTENPPPLPSQGSSYWRGNTERNQDLVNQGLEYFVRKGDNVLEKSDAKAIYDISRARADARSEKRKLVSLNEANEVAKRLAIQSEAKARACREQDQSSDDEDQRDEVSRWYFIASRFKDE
ncbi:hypothetical protein EYZ11_003498 [Aspergillus tanneri]|uniref:Ankyrin repeat protein n=1 Tax=Aspergillus tanneri TaxID=1220188 RepID=A0A4S3JNE5_9EURO|nr:uncharacterized protein ATNIH1004_007030 [Aspergillus tanneri]KAA8645611.1 hypothetical protein ATNIH1004_007030 [Aspergillus tanneri]THC97055.1 hypothetical protein EYZ11_003498 [Aspergillus tanneri]